MQGAHGGGEQVEQQADSDIGHDEIWQQQEQAMAANRENVRDFHVTRKAEAGC